MANKGRNRGNPMAHKTSTAGGPGSKRKANSLGTSSRAKKYAAQWARTAANKARKAARNS